MNKITEVQKIISAYYEGIDWEPVVKHDWVEAYINVLHFNRNTDDLIGVWEDIQSLILYIERTTYTSLSELPWWEYSVALEWIYDHFWVPERFDVNLENAGRMIGRWRDFYVYLSKTWMNVSGIDLEAIEQAFQKICGSDKLKMVKKIPYTGDEFWLGTARPGSSHIVDFTVAEFWLILAYFELGESWDTLEEELKTVPSMREKRKRLQSLRGKLELAGYSENPIDLVRGHVDQEDLENTERWFFRKRIPQRKEK